MPGIQEDTTTEILLWAGEGDTMIPIYMDDLPPYFRSLYQKDPVQFTAYLQDAIGLTITLTITRKITARSI